MSKILKFDVDTLLKCGSHPVTVTYGNLRAMTILIS